MRSIRAKIVAAAVPVAFFFGCSLTTDFTGLAGPSPATTPQGGTYEGGVGALDAGADALVEATTRFCVAGVHAFCDDFDLGAPLASWDRQYVDPKGALSVSTLRAKSAPGSLLSTRARRAALDPRAQATVDKQFPGVRRIIVEFDVFLETPVFASGDINSGIVGILFNSTGSKAPLALSAGKTYTALGIPGTSVTGAPLTGDTWLHARFDFDPAGTVQGSIGGSS